MRCDPRIVPLVENTVSRQMLGFGSGCDEDELEDVYILFVYIS